MTALHRQRGALSPSQSSCSQASSIVISPITVTFITTVWNLPQSHCRAPVRPYSNILYCTDQEDAERTTTLFSTFGVWVDGRGDHAIHRIPSLMARPHASTVLSLWVPAVFHNRGTALVQHLHLKGDMGKRGYCACTPACKARKGSSPWTRPTLKALRRL